jgi:hypothetical protein
MVTNALIRSWDESSSTGFGRLEIKTNDASSLKRRALFDYNGDVSFYEDTGTSPKFVWDSSAEALGIGTASPSTSMSAGTAPTRHFNRYLNIRLFAVECYRCRQRCLLRLLNNDASDEWTGANQLMEVLAMRDIEPLTHLG